MTNYIPELKEDSTPEIEHIINLSTDQKIEVINLAMPYIKMSVKSCLCRAIEDAYLDLTNDLNGFGCVGLILPEIYEFADIGKHSFCFPPTEIGQQQRLGALLKIKSNLIKNN